jgi:hypothetical protein
LEWSCAAQKIELIHAVDRPIFGQCRARNAGQGGEQISNVYDLVTDASMRYAARPSLQ